MNEAMRTVEVDEDVAELVEEDEDLRHATREALVMKLFRTGKVSSGRACELLGLDHDGFLRLANALDVPVYLTTEEDWEREKATINAWLGS
jgi:predicted HTH domain antitoxin